MNLCAFYVKNKSRQVSKDMNNAYVTIICVCKLRYEKIYLSGCSDSDVALCFKPHWRKSVGKTENIYIRYFARGFDSDQAILFAAAPS